MDATQHLIWEYTESPNFHQYALSNGEQTVSVLRLEHIKQYDAVVEIGEERFLIEKHLTAPYHLIVRRDGSDDILMRFEADMKATGQLKLANDTTLLWTHKNILVPSWAFEELSGHIIIDILGHFGFQRPSSEITVGPDVTISTEVLLLATLGWYIILITNLYPTYIFSR